MLISHFYNSRRNLPSHRNINKNKDQYWIFWLTCILRCKIIISWKKLCKLTQPGRWTCTKGSLPVYYDFANASSLMHGCIFYQEIIIFLYVLNSALKAYPFYQKLFFKTQNICCNIHPCSPAIKRELCVVWALSGVSCERYKLSVGPGGAVGSELSPQCRLNCLTANISSLWR